MKIYLTSPEQIERLETSWSVTHEAWQRHEYERTLEHLGRLLEHLHALEAQPGLVDQRAHVRNMRAELLMQLGRWDQAMEDIDKILASESQLTDRKLLVQAFVASARISSYYGDFADAVSILERALSMREEILNRGALASILLELGTVYSRIGEVQQGRDKFEEVEQLLKPKDELDEEERGVLASAYTQIGLTFFRERRLREAQKYYLSSLELSDHEAPPTQLMADTYRYMGILSNVSGENTEALRYHDRALEIYSKLRLLLGQAKTYSSVGQTCLDLSRLDEALYFTHKAERISRRLGAEAEVAAIYGKLGNIYVQMGDYNRAVEFHLKDVEMCRRFGNYRAIAYAMHNLGLSYRGKGEISEAIHYLQESLSRFQELADSLQVTRLLLDLARTCLDRSRLADAEEYLVTADSQIARDPHNPHLGYLQLLLGSLYRLQQNPEEARDLLEQAIDVLSVNTASTHLAQANFELGLLMAEAGNKEGALEHLKTALRLSRTLEMRNVMLDCIAQIERLDELELVKVLLEDVVSKDPFEADPVYRG